MKSRRRVLFFPFPLLSHYLRCQHLALFLPEDYELYFPAHPYYSAILEPRINLFACENFKAAEVMQAAKNFDFSWLNKKNIERIYRAQVACLLLHQADFVISDASPSLRMAAETVGVPMLSVLNGYMSRYYERVRQLSRTHVAFQLLKALPPGLAKNITEKAERLALKKVHLPFRSIRRDYGLSTQRDYLSECEGELTLICDRPELFPQKNLPVSFRFVGPLFHSSTSALTNISWKKVHSKRLVVSYGSTGDSEHFKFLASPLFSSYEILFAGCSSAPDAPHIRAISFTNLVPLLATAAILICHGGNGTTSAALAAGIPSLCITTHFEQEWNVQGLEAMGFGEDISTAATPELCLARIEKWIFAHTQTKFKQMRQAMETSMSDLNLETCLRELQTPKREVA